MIPAVEELNQIRDAFRIKLPRETIEDHLNQTYCNSTWNIQRVLNDIESGGLVVKPNAHCWDILKDVIPCPIECEYSIGFRDITLIERTKIELVIDQYRLDEEIKQLDLKQAIRNIYVDLMNAANNSMQRELQNDEEKQWYCEHRFSLDCCVAMLVEDVITGWKRFGGNRQYESFTDSFVAPLRKRLKMELINIKANQ